MNGDWAKWYSCSACTDDLKVTRRCPKPPHDPDFVENARRETGLEADPEHPEACPVLKLEADRELLSWLADLPDFQAGHLRGTSLRTTPHWWLVAQRAGASELKRLEREALEAQSTGPAPFGELPGLGVSGPGFTDPDRY